MRVKMGREGKVITGEVPLSRALREQDLQVQEARKKETSGGEATRYESQDDYDPVLASHCRIDTRR